MTVEEQVDLVGAFVRGVVERFGYDATTSTRVEDERLYVDVAGEDLGLLIGPRGATLDALQELARTVVQRRGDERALRVVVDVAGFRAAACRGTRDVHAAPGGGGAGDRGRRGARADVSVGPEDRPRHRGDDRRPGDGFGGDRPEALRRHPSRCRAEAGERPSRGLTGGAGPMGLGGRVKGR